MTPERLAEIRIASIAGFGVDACAMRDDLLALVDDLAGELERQADAIERQLSDLETARAMSEHHAAEADRLAEYLEHAEYKIDTLLATPCFECGHS